MDNPRLHHTTPDPSDALEERAQPANGRPGPQPQPRPAPQLTRPAMALIRINVPPALFDLAEGETAYILRLRRCPVARHDAMRQASDAAEVYEHIAHMVPSWKGIRDCESGELLANPSEDPSVLARLDVYEQLPWLTQQLRSDPKAGAPTTSGRIP